MYHNDRSTRCTILQSFKNEQGFSRLGLKPHVTCRLTGAVQCASFKIIK